MRYPAGEGQVDLDHDGRVVAVRHPAHRDLRWLSGLDLTTVLIGGTAVAWDDRRVATDVDEVEIAATAGPVRARLRHSFWSGWTTRLMLSVEADHAPVEEVEVRLAVRAADAAGWGIATGVGATVAYLPAQDAPLLLARLTEGAAASIDEDGWHFGPVALAADRRWVAQVRWDWLPTPRAVLDLLPATQPRRTVLAVGDALTVTGDPDLAVVVDPLPAGRDRAVVDEVDGLRSVLAYEEGRHRLAVHSGRGTTVVDVLWTAPPVELLTAAAELALAGPRTPSHVPRLSGLPAALVVQHAVRRRGMADPDAGEDALDLFTVRAESPTDPAETGLWALFLLGEHDRTGDLELLVEAERLVAVAAHADRACPGLGLAAVRLRIACHAADRPFRTVAGALTGLVERTADVARAPLDLDAAELVLGVGGLVPPVLRRLGAETAVGLSRSLGGGLPGAATRSLDGPGAIRVAHAATVLRLVPFELGAAVGRDTGDSPEGVADHAVLALSADRQLAGPPTWAHAWLALADQSADT